MNLIGSKCSCPLFFGCSRILGFLLLPPLLPLSENVPSKAFPQPATHLCLHARMGPCNLMDSPLPGCHEVPFGATLLASLDGINIYLFKCSHILPFLSISHWHPFTLQDSAISYTKRKNFGRSDTGSPF